jgi:hypothetical protein
MTRITLALAELQHQIGFAAARHELCGTRRKAYAGFWIILEKDGTSPSRSSALAYARSAFALLLLNEFDAIASERVVSVSSVGRR